MVIRWRCCWCGADGDGDGDGDWHTIVACQRPG
jgi:hypothetical protein